ncbi:glycosyltransferase [Novosphingopyxis sp. YJ-S2-01]|uniref:glycosyltransferase n=1 Tax=Novosphingopyxis sp. YJ-S2-01 TaxID=2794021 RepID=UPI0018DB0290|nr:glycosyltransferase [Novosphingopyxis sp. YJ-S2-01]MBH9538459.1 glycosyltransferase [Novosphingopyxis sp. YJ-S2-01]
MKSSKPTTLYMCYDGILEPLGESQVVAYLEHLASHYNIHLISFEKSADIRDEKRIAVMEDRLRAASIVWHPHRYHKRPKILSTLWDMSGAVVHALVLAIRHRVRIVHSRSILCAAMVWPAQVISGARSIVDIRGFWADERVDGGMIGQTGAVYRVLKVIEKAMLRRADHIVTLTHASVPYLREDVRFGRATAPIDVIPTCTDLDHFTAEDGPTHERPLTIGYVGQIGTWYMLDEMITFFKAVQRRRPDAKLLLINRNQQDELRRAVHVAGIDSRDVEITGATRATMPAQIRRMDAALAFITPYFSKIASAPTKLAEYLGCGVPVVGNEGCGDMARILEEEGVGVAIATVNGAAIEEAADALLKLLPDPELPKRCVTSAQRHFSLTRGIESYRRIYRSLLSSSI